MEAGFLFWLNNIYGVFFHTEQGEHLYYFRKLTKNDKMVY